MDFFFEDDIDEVGAETDGFCPKCKADTNHTVITKYEDEVRRVQCNVCSDVHSYRKPRGEVEDDIPEPVSARKRATVKKASWVEAADHAGDKNLYKARPYEVSEVYALGDILTHVHFGLGFVTDVQENKVEITFQDDRRVLAHGRADLAPKMPSAALSTAERARKHAEAIHVALGRNGKQAPAVDQILQGLRDRREADERRGKKGGVPVKGEAPSRGRAAAGGGGGKGRGGRERPAAAAGAPAPAGKGAAASRSAGPVARAVAGAKGAVSRGVAAARGAAAKGVAAVKSATTRTGPAKAKPAPAARGGAARGAKAASGKGAAVKAAAKGAAAKAGARAVAAKGAAKAASGAKPGGARAASKGGARAASGKGAATKGAAKATKASRPAAGAKGGGSRGSSPARGKKPASRRR